MNDKCPNCGSDLENMGDGKQICWCCGYLRIEEMEVKNVKSSNSNRQS